METSEGTPSNTPQEVNPAAQDKDLLEVRARFEQRARFLYEKYGLTDSVRNLDQVVEVGSSFAEKYRVPEKFWEDDANLGVILGCAEKLSENIHPLYRNRLENLMLRLVQPAINDKQLIDPVELWGEEPEHGGLNEEETKKYVQENTDPEATTQFLQEYAEEISCCKIEWTKRGYNLQVSANIVEDKVVNFKRKVGAGGYVHVPERTEIEKIKKAEVQIVLLKGYSAEAQHLVKHELYHIEDYWNFFRRGYKNGIWESIDELHTEYAAGNYKEDRSEKDECKASYFELKEFWDRLTFTGGVDFNLLNDRQKLLESVGKNFGFSGLADFALLYAHPSGKIAIFETFFGNHTRPLLDMLVSREKILLRKAQARGDRFPIESVSDNIIELARLMTPELEEKDSVLYRPSFSEKYRRLAEMVPGPAVKIYTASRADKEFNFSINRESAKELMVSFSRALAIAELVSSGEVVTTPETQVLLTSLEAIPFKRSDPAFEPESYINRQTERAKEYSKEVGEKELYLEEVRNLFHGLVSDMEDSLDFSFSLTSANVRETVLKDFRLELSKMGRFVVSKQDPAITRSFVLGMYGYNIPYEIREEATKYLSDQFPQLAAEIAARKAVFNSKKVFNTSF